MWKEEEKDELKKRKKILNATKDSSTNAHSCRAKIGYQMSFAPNADQHLLSPLIVKLREKGRNAMDLESAEKIISRRKTVH